MEEVLSLVLLNRSAFPHRKVSSCYWRGGCSHIPGDQIPLQARAGLPSPAQKPCNTRSTPSHTHTLTVGTPPLWPIQGLMLQKSPAKTQILIKCPKTFSSWSITLITVLCPRVWQILCFNSPWSSFAHLALLIVLLTACPFISDLTAWL